MGTDPAGGAALPQSPIRQTGVRFRTLGGLAFGSSERPRPVEHVEARGRVPTHICLPTLYALRCWWLPPSSSTSCTTRGRPPHGARFNATKSVTARRSRMSFLHQLGSTGPAMSSSGPRSLLSGSPTSCSGSTCLIDSSERQRLLRGGLAVLDHGQRRGDGRNGTYAWLTLPPAMARRLLGTVRA